MTRLVYPALPVLDCAPAPAPPPVAADDNAWATWKARDHDAGQDCREKLGAVKDVAGTWPRGTGTDRAAP